MIYYMFPKNSIYLKSFACILLDCNQVRARENEKRCIKSVYFCVSVNAICINKKKKNTD